MRHSVYLDALRAAAIDHDVLDAPACDGTLLATRAVASMPAVLLVCHDANRTFDIKTFAAGIGEGRTAAINVAALERMTGFAPGTVTPLRAAGRRRFPLYLDAAWALRQQLCVNGGARNLFVRLAMKDFIKHLAPNLVDLSYLSG